MRRLLLVLFAATFRLLFAGNAASAQLLKWRADSLLTWNDFKGKKPAKLHRHDAMTHSRWVHNLYKDSAGNTRLRVTNYFDCQKSWSLYKRLKPLVLQHEQTHFDVSELFARKARKEFADYNSSHDMQTSDGYPLMWIYRHEYTLMRRYQHRYDRRIKHSGRREQQEQLKWSADVSRQLEELRAFAEP